MEIATSGQNTPFLAMTVGSRGVLGYGDCVARAFGTPRNEVGEWDPNKGICEFLAIVR